MQDLYTWRVMYEDGTIIDEYDAERTDGRGFGEVDLIRVRRLEIEAYNDVLTSHIVHIPKAGRPVFFRRRYLAVGTENRATVHCIGWQKEESAVYLFVFEDGSTLLSDDLQAV